MRVTAGKLGRRAPSMTADFRDPFRAPEPDVIDVWPEQHTASA